MTSDNTTLDRHIEAVKARHAGNKDEEREYHDFVAETLAGKGAAKEQILKDRNAAALAHLIRHADVRAGISKLDDASKIRELKRIREGESAGPEKDPDSNESTETQLGPKATRLRGHTRRTGLMR